MRKLEVISYKLRVTVLLLLLAVFTLDLTGCAQLQKKFTRKKKAALTKLPAYRPVKEYKKQPAAELYQRHYVFWSSWHSELLSVMGQNRKKDTRCIGEIISNLKDMQNILTPEKGAELEKHIAKLEVVRGKIAEGPLSTYDTISIRDTLEHEEKVIEDNFRYKKVKDYLRENSGNGL